MRPYVKHSVNAHPAPLYFKELRFLKNHRGRGAQDFFVKMEGGNPYREVVYQTGDVSTVFH